MKIRRKDTDMKEAEDKLATLSGIMQAVQPVTLEQEIDHAIADNSCSLAVDLDTGIIVLAKPAAEALFGYLPGTMKGISVHDLVPERLREVHKRWFAAYRISPANRVMGSRGMELRGVTREGTEFPVEIGLAAVDLGEIRIGIATIIPMVTRREVIEATVKVERPEKKA